VTRDGREPCALRGVKTSCDGPKDAHHYVPKRRIDLMLDGKHGDRSILAKQDSRNGVCLCRGHHELVEAGVLDSPAPAFLGFFLADHGLTVRPKSTPVPRPPRPGPQMCHGGSKFSCVTDNPNSLGARERPRPDDDDA
jgi:hypothetical protein